MGPSPLGQIRNAQLFLIKKAYRKAERLINSLMKVPLKASLLNHIINIAVFLFLGRAVNAKFVFRSFHALDDIF